MWWLLTAARRLRQLGILSMNRRNATCILDHNPRHLFPLVDDKLRLHQLCQRLGIPTPQIYAVISSHAMLCHLRDYLRGHEDFVLKPNRGSAGRGVLVIQGRQGEHYLRHNGRVLHLEEIRQHLSDLLSGMYSLGARPDWALVQQRVCLHPAFAAISYKGIPDIRIILYRGEPAMAMLRLPTRASDGRANLHQGGIGAGIDLDSGRTCHAVLRQRVVERHPDTGVSVIGVAVPCWQEILALARRVAAAIGLGYLGVDIVLDAQAGPLLLEANARPGLAIQTANGQGLVPRLRTIDAQKASMSAPPAGRHRHRTRLALPSGVAA